jgi:ketosteroid isomerase-like protein
MEKQELIAIAERVLGAWNRQDVDAAVDCYTENCAYIDPNTRGPVVGHENLHRYLAKLFSRWKMHWTMRELFPLGGDEGSAFLWHAKLTPAGGRRTIEVEGMDLALLEGEKLRRNEVYFDRMALVAAGQKVAAGA